MNKVTKLIISILICEGVGVLGSIFTISQIPVWYALINKPYFTPPSYIFGPVWTTLFALMGISLYLVSEVKSEKHRYEFFYFFFAQLFLNFYWSVLFFYAHLLTFALIDIWGLLLVLMLLTFKTWKISKLASILLVPYILWVLFASFLNLSIVLLNP